MTSKVLYFILLLWYNISKMKRHLFLYLALACFVGLLAIFIVDGYLGVYDTVYVTAGEREQQIEPDFWSRQDSYWSTGTNWGEKVFFRYEVENHQFATYISEVSVSLWRSQEKVRDLVSERMVVASFDKGKLEWQVDTEELKPSGVTPEQPYEFSVIIKRGELERRVIFYINPVVKPLPTRVP